MASFNILSHSLQTMFRSVSQLIGMLSFVQIYVALLHSAWYN